MRRNDPDIAEIGLFGTPRGLLEHRVRLAACVLLARHEAISFSRLKQVLEENDGSLGTHLRKLEDAGYLLVEKSFRDRRPVTWYQLTDAGRKELNAHIANLKRLIEQIN